MVSRLLYYTYMDRRRSDLEPLHLGRHNCRRVIVDNITFAYNTPHLRYLFTSFYPSQKGHNYINPPLMMVPDQPQYHIYTRIVANSNYHLCTLESVCVYANISRITFRVVRAYMVYAAM